MKVFGSSLVNPFHAIIEMLAITLAMRREQSSLLFSYFWLGFLNPSPSLEEEKRKFSYLLKL